MLTKKYIDEIVEEAYPDGTAEYKKAASDLIFSGVKIEANNRKTVKEIHNMHKRCKMLQKLVLIVLQLAVYVVIGVLFCVLLDAPLWAGVMSAMVLGYIIFSWKGDENGI